jgi:hypothetical protein
MQRIQSFKFLSLVLGIALIFSITGNVWLFQRNDFHKIGGSIQASLEKNIGKIKKVSAQEIYPLFACPCCGKTINAECCGMAKERKLYIDALTQGRLSKEEIIAVYVKKYGLDSFKDEKQRQEFKERLIREAPIDRPVISVAPDAYDFGDVSQAKGTVSALFEITNTGQDDLVISKLETSCGCTSASIVFQGKEGPRFSMPGHNINERIGKWQVTIPPGEKAHLKVYYNPSVHQDFRGAAVREIYIFSNDPVDFEKKVKIELNQVD